MTCYFGDCRVVMRELIAQGMRVQMCVTSPPYWGLRDYGTATWEGGDSECDHMPDADTLERQNGRSSTLVGTTTHQKQAAIARHSCHCGARRIDSQLGLEPTPEAYVANMVEVFRLVREVLADDGVLWLNLGDSYSTGGSGQNFSAEHGSTANSTTTLGGYGHRKQAPVDGMLPKNLVGIPWRVAFALQADGWYLRQDIIWSKPNPMPESVTDRCTKAHEYIFLLAKRERYYYDAAAIAEKVNTGYRGIDIRNKRSVWTVATKPYSEAHFATFPPALIEPCILAGSRPGDTVLDPFFGSGTVGEVCQNLGREWIGIELNEAYKPLQQRRTAQLGMTLV